MTQDPTTDFGEVASALEGIRTPVYEPALAQTDEWAKNIIMDTLFVFKTVKETESGRIVRIIDDAADNKGHKYPPLEPAAAYALSHQNLTVNLPWHVAKAKILDWKGYFYDPLRVKYRRNPEALNLLNVLNSIITRNIDASIEGKHQNYIKDLTTGRILNVRNEGEKK